MRHGKYILFHKKRMRWASVEVGQTVIDKEEQNKVDDHEHFGEFIDSGTLWAMRKRFVDEVMKARKQQLELHPNKFVVAFVDRAKPDNLQIFDCTRGTWMKADQIQPFFKEELKIRDKALLKYEAEEKKKDRAKQSNMSAEEFHKYMVNKIRNQGFGVDFGMGSSFTYTMPKDYPGF